jgi:hypothetical protein
MLLDITSYGGSTERECFRMPAKSLPSADYLNQRLRYDAETGKLFWKARAAEGFSAKTPARAKSLCDLWNARYADTEAFTYLSDGYLVGAVDGTNYKAHRVIWKMVNGTEPENIDHIDGNRSRNVLENMRAATLVENNRNRKRPVNNKSGVIGVYLWSHKGCEYWTALVAPKRYSYFKTFDEAVSARKAAEVEMGFHENHGREPSKGEL